MDVSSERRIVRAIQKLIGGTTCILITHNPKLIQFMDRIVVMEGGRIVEIGRHADLLARGGAYADMLGVRLEGAAARPALKEEAL